MAIYIAGMHRSNSSVLSLMLGACGVDLGPRSEDFPGKEDDNPDGYGEHRPTVKINEMVLNALGGAWNAPPEPPADWIADKRLRSARKKAEALLRERAPRDPWGWKDPRNSLTLPFWRSLTPVEKIVIPVRHPLEVAKSLLKGRGIAIEDGLRLWEIYNRRIMEASSAAERIVCHADSLCGDHEAELRRIVKFLGLDVAPADLAAANALFRNDRRRHSCAVDFVADSRLFPSLIELYERLCQEAGVAQ